MAALDHDLLVAMAMVGHRCPSAALAARMSRQVCRVLGVADPAACDELLLYVEMDRCGTSVVEALTGLTPLGLRDLDPARFERMTLTIMDVAADRGVRAEVRQDVLAASSLRPMTAADPRIPDADILVVSAVWAEHSSEHPAGRTLREIWEDEPRRVAPEPKVWPRLVQSPGVGLPAADLSAMLLTLGPWPLWHKAPRVSIEL